MVLWNLANKTAPPYISQQHVGWEDNISIFGTLIDRTTIVAGPVALKAVNPKLSKTEILCEC